jgi:hypothetical protein
MSVARRFDVLTGCLLFMPAFSCVLFNRFALFAVLSTASASSSAHCDFICGAGEESPLQITQFTGLLVATTVLSPFYATSEVSGLNKRVYSVEEIEAARYFLASDGMLQAAYFTSALQRYRQESSDSALNDLAVAALISAQ